MHCESKSISNVKQMVLRELLMNTFLGHLLYHISESPHVLIVILSTNILWQNVQHVLYCKETIVKAAAESDM